MCYCGPTPGVFAVHTEIMPVNRTSFASLDQARLENYLRDILRDPEVPEEKEGWIRVLGSDQAKCLR